MMNTIDETASLKALPTAALIERYCWADAIAPFSDFTFSLLRELERRIPNAMRIWMESEEYADCEYPTMLYEIIEKYGEA